MKRHLFWAVAAMLGMLDGAALADGDVRDIESALDPSAAIEAYARAVAVAPDDPAVQDAYVRRMIAMGAPELAGTQAGLLLKRDPNHPQAWAVVAFESLMAERPADALRHVQRALELSPRDPFVLGIGGQVAAWYDVLGRLRGVPAQDMAQAAELRRLHGVQTEFSQAYMQATDAYQEVLKTELPDGADASAPPVTLPAPAPEPEVVYAEPEYVEPVYTSPGYYYPDYYYEPIWWPSSYFYVSLHYRHAARYCDRNGHHRYSHDRNRHDGKGRSDHRGDGDWGRGDRDNNGNWSDRGSRDGDGRDRGERGDRDRSWRGLVDRDRTRSPDSVTPTPERVERRREPRQATYNQPREQRVERRAEPSRQVQAQPQRPVRVAPPAERPVQRPASVERSSDSRGRSERSSAGSDRSRGRSEHSGSRSSHRSEGRSSRGGSRR